MAHVLSLLSAALGEGRLGVLISPSPGDEDLQREFPPYRMLDLGGLVSCVLAEGAQFFGRYLATVQAAGGVHDVKSLGAAFQ